MTLRSKRKGKGDLRGGTPLFNIAEKQGLPASGRENNETHCSGSEKCSPSSTCKHKVKFHKEPSVILYTYVLKEKSARI